MITKPVTGLAMLLSLLAPLPAATQGTAPMPAPIVFVDIVGNELPKQAAFYREVFGWQIGADGGFAAPVAAPLQGSLRVEDPKEPPERVIYLGVPDINARLAIIEAHGGKTVLPRLEVKGVVILALFTDPGGNRMGLVEMEGGKAKVPR